ncbi:MAG: helix-hairpin-helix domain-containing protein [Chloroflexi bacterium]|nr:helix-hairpin-helix domain-containing protein [Chloroflexota bacterium]
MIVVLVLGDPVQRSDRTNRIFQPLLWALVGAGVAGGLFFLLNIPRDVGITIAVATPTPLSEGQSSLTPDKQRVDINTASVKELDASLPGIGPVKAQAIVDYRDRNGPFQRIDELMKVPGIGPSTYQAVKDLITVGPAP